ncbi:carboxymuconolactone decarboxylase family protein [Acinetobacter baumannii]|uniref:carboxymuconolactone decarboxylase family protein n=1 Tax=Acinetobacter baumannii TaxID=470 RepID=UPI00233FDA19|nr:carboxymuconolactone decarboxylase family protein [Acinetobacter baumannii]MDC4414442.1 carboxymuconolactone decarboxylase family protein [Acinetobacter baumannii]MDH2520319.1 carboxymuconolactone decarboxylase family protein [Acinetobacter baumannii]MDK2200806.1 carboxymuconolactone decarboxylase family protein [Acinetobacter baumannii]
MNYTEIAKKSIGHLYQSHTSIRQSGIDNKLIALAELRASQLNGCAYCCSFHTKELRDMGIDQDLIDKIPGYKHSISFDVKQDLVLQWTDALTLLSDNLEEIKEELKKHFTERELVELTTSISLMNALNRLRITLGDKF